jgi:Ornithine decarboxylase antizyme
MKTVFHGERSAFENGSGLMGALMNTPPPDDGPATINNRFLNSYRGNHPFEVVAWLEIWDWVGSVSFRAFLTDDGSEKSLFAFFDYNAVIGRELKSA